MAEENQNQAEDGREFAIQRVYVKDLSFETPDSPHIFKSQWEPDMNLELHTSSEYLQDDTYEVVLSGTVTVKSADKHAFLVEVKQAGIFTIKGFDDKDRSALLGSVCASILFPYLREVASDVVTRGSFPQLILAPVNFDALYAQHLEREAQNDTEDAS